jgi:Family of unknown function (DUF6480)
VTADNPDPDPADTPSIAGGVAPGDTPPDSAQTSAGNADPVAGHNLNPRSILGIAVVVLFVLLFAVAAVLMTIRLF